MAGSELIDAPVPVRYKLSALWAALMFCYIYGDYFGSYVPGKLSGIIGGEGPIGHISQSSLVVTSVLLAVPGLMVFLSLALPSVLCRWSNVVLSAFYIAVMALTMPGAWSFYLLLGSLEILLGLLTIGYALRWPREPSAASVSPNNSFKPKPLRGSA
jgi:hypothetical protein